MYDSDVDETQETARGYLKINCPKYLLPVLFLLSLVSRYNAVKIWSAKCYTPPCLGSYCELNINGHNIGSWLGTIPLNTNACSKV